MYYRFKTIIQILVRITGILPNPIIRFFYYLIEPFPGNFFVLLRYLFISSLCKSVGDNVYIANYVEIRFFDNLVLGSNISIQRNCYIDAIGGIEIGNDVSIAHQSSLISFDHDWKDPTLPIRKNPLVPRPIVLKDDLWIGAGVRILAGAIIENRSIVAAGAVVTKNSDHESGILLAGVPAKKKLELH